VSVFADRFEVMGFVHTRCAAPSPDLALQLEERSARSFKATGPLGAFQIATFVDRASFKLYARLYHFETHETAWYVMTPDRETLAKIVATGGDGKEAAKL
jgi:hypothetical protein